MKNFLLFLDFDGVICNSVLECLYSATIAYFVKYQKSTIQSLPLSFKERFLSIRPYIRTGEDYVVLADLAYKEIGVKSQEEFDKQLNSHSKEELKVFRELFYQTRRELLEKDFSFWMELNPLYEGLKDTLQNVSDSQKVYILSTKAADLIERILHFHGVDWPKERILYSNQFSKKEIIQSLLVKGMGAQAILVDDQLDHLLSAKEENKVIPYLATWGYIKPEWKEDPRVSTLSLEGFRNLLSRFSHLTLDPKGNDMHPA
ncbi:MAG: hypothetical protein SNJ78_00500 [Spirochaetales bacterium]